MLPDHIQLSSQPGQDLQRFIAEKKYSNVLALVDENTLTHCLPIIENYLPDHFVLQIKSGEENKTLATCTRIWEVMTEHQLDRHSVLIILGGGVLGDMGGFCAATYKRGIDFILIPTTLLAQTDASIGGKLGVDFNHLKNHLGVFKEPALTLLNDSFLNTLPESELRSGFAEVIKHALISDRKLWNTIRQKDLKTQNWAELLRHSAEFKYSIVQQDPHEKGLRKILNAGHTIGHALESFFLSQNNKIMHGEAVAAGLVAEASMAEQRTLLSKDDLQEISEYILKIYPKINIPENKFKEIAALCRQDKKNKGNSILAVLPEGIGKATWDCEISEEDVVRSLAFYRSLQT